MDSQTSIRYTDRLSQRKLWFGTLAAAAAWALDGFICFLISTQACANATGNLGALPAAGVRILLGVITIIFLAIALTGGVISFRNWRALPERPGMTHAEGLNREAFMALIGVFLSVAFVIGIIWAGIPLIFLRVCVNAR